MNGPSCWLQSNHPGVNARGYYRCAEKGVNALNYQSLLLQSDTQRQGKIISAARLARFTALSSRSGISPVL